MAPLSILCLDVLLHPLPMITAKMKLLNCPASQEKRNERTATPLSPKEQNIWIQYCDPNGYLIL